MDKNVVVDHNQHSPEPIELQNFQDTLLVYLR